MKRNKKKRVTSVTKSNAQGYGMALWDRAFQEVAAQFPDLETEPLPVDAAAWTSCAVRGISMWWWSRSLIVLSYHKALRSRSAGARQ